MYCHGLLKIGTRVFLCHLEASCIILRIFRGCRSSFGSIARLSWLWWIGRRCRSLSCGGLSSRSRCFKNFLSRGFSAPFVSWGIFLCSSCQTFLLQPSSTFLGVITNKLCIFHLPIIQIIHKVSMVPLNYLIRSLFYNLFTTQVAS